MHTEYMALPLGGWGRTADATVIVSAAARDRLLAAAWGNLGFIIVQPYYSSRIRGHRL